MRVIGKYGRAFACLWAIALGACVRSKPPELVAPPEIRLGEFATRTGPQSPFGEAAHRGVQMAVDEANAQGGVTGRKIRLVSYDDRGEPSEAARLVERLATSDGALAVIGEVATALSLAAAPVAQRLKVPMISPGSTHPNVTKVGDYVFRVCFTDPFQGAAMARFALNNLKLKKAAVLFDEGTEYSKGLAEHFMREYAAGGGRVLAKGSYASGAQEFRKELAPLLAVKPEALFLPGYFTEAGPLARQARNMGFKGVFLGGDGWEGERLRESGGKAIVGAYFTNHFSPEDQNPEASGFVARFKARYSEVPGSISAIGYDAARVALDAIRRAPKLTPAAVRETLATTRNFPGVSGIITINASRDAVKPAVVLQVAAHGPHRYVTTINP